MAFVLGVYAFGAYGVLLGPLVSGALLALLEIYKAYLPKVRMLLLLLLLLFFFIIIIVVVVVVDVLICRMNWLRVLLSMKTLEKLLTKSMMTKQQE
jgi:hypothetical protein